MEWNYHFISNENQEIKDILKEFNELYEKNSFELTIEWLRKYEKRYRTTYKECFSGIVAKS